MNEKSSIQARVTKNEYEIINGRASLLGLSVSNYVRLVCLNASVKIECVPGQKSNLTPPTTVKRSSEKKDKILQARLTDEEYQIVENKASKLGITVPSYISFVTLNATIHVMVDIKE